MVQSVALPIADTVPTFGLLEVLPEMLFPVLNVSRPTTNFKPTF